MSRSASWVARRLALADELPAEIQDLLRSGKIPASAAMKDLVPLVRRDRQAGLRLARAAAEHRLTSRQIAQLHIAWRTARGARSVGSRSWFGWRGSRLHSTSPQRCGPLSA